MASKKKRVLQTDLTLNFIAELGGEKGDIGLLQDIDDDDDDDNESVEIDEDLDADPVNHNELKQFINSLGITQYRDTSEQNESKRTKELVEKPVAKEDGKEKETPQLVSKKKQRNKYKALQHDEVTSTTAADPVTDFNTHVAQYKARNFLLLKPRQQWRDTDTEPVSAAKTSSDIEHQMEQFASKLLQDEVAVYNKQKENSKKSEAGWIKTVLSSGTLGDKIAALTLLVQESPVHNLSSLDTLINMAKKKGKRECMMAADTLKEVFASFLLPEGKKLKHFNQFPLGSVCELASGNRDTLDRWLIMWHFESELKKRYLEFIKALDAMSHDTLLAAKQKALGVLFELLVQKPEQEKKLLSMIVNKVGDPDYKLASKASHYLTRLVDRHPNMKTVVVDEVERLLYRPNVPVKAQYYCVCFLNQLLLSHEEKMLAAKLIGVYFSFFKAFVKKGEVDSKMMSALLSGVNRAYPFAKVKEEFINEQMDTLYKIVHVVNFNTSVQSLMLLYQVMDSSQSISDRYYVALYRKMSDPALKSSAKQTVFLNLLFKSIRKDVSGRRVKAFLKRLLQICPYHSPQFTCGVLVLLGEIIKDKSGLLLTKHAAQEADDSDEEEHFTDLPAPDDQELLEEKHSSSEEEDEKNTDDDNRKGIKPSWVHMAVSKGNIDYDPHHRNPLYCRADQECVWELEKLASHFHPSVALFAQNLLHGKKISYSGDPLQDFTTKRFLDRFVYKNPKKQDNAPDHTGMLSKAKCKSNKPIRGLKMIPVNSEKYLLKSEADIPVEEKFFFKYFSQKEVLDKKKKRDNDSEDEGSVVSDTEFDSYLDRYESSFDFDGLGKMDFSGLDFAGEMGKRGKKKTGTDDSDDESDDNLDDLSDEEVDFGDDFGAAFKDFDDLDNGDDDNDQESDDDDGIDGEGFEEVDEDEFDEENINFSSEDELGELQLKPDKKKGKRKAEDESITPKKHKKRSKGLEGLLASAEEFSGLMDNDGLKMDMVGSEALSNKDNAHVKQLKWEVERDRKIKGHNRRQKSFGKKSYNKHGNRSSKKQVNFHSKQGSKRKGGRKFQHKRK